MNSFVLVAADVVKTGGMDRANYALAEYLAARGVEIHLVSHGVGGGLLRLPSVQWHRVPRPLGHDALGWSLLARAGRRRARALSPGGGRVLVNGGNCGWPDLNWVHYVHATWAPELSGGAGARAWQRWKFDRARRDERAALAQARLIFANSERTRADLIALLGLPADKICTVYYGCDAAQFAPLQPGERQRCRAELGWPQQGRVALFVGALGDRRKGFDTLFEAWQRLAASSEWDVTLAVAGRGAELPRWQTRAREAGLGERIRFLGFRRDVPRLLAASDLLVSPTRYEAYGLAVQEAVAREVPVLVSASAGVAERLRPELVSWLLDDPESVSELVARLQAWRVAGRELHTAVAAVGARLRAHSWDAMAAGMLARAGIEVAA